MAPVVFGFSSWLNTFVMLENTKKGSQLVGPNLSSCYLFELNFHQLYLAVDIIGRWTKRHNTIVLQDNAFQNILYITEVIH